MFSMTMGNKRNLLIGRTITPRQITHYPLIVTSTEKTFLVHRCYILIGRMKPLWLEWLEWLEWLVRKRTFITQFSSRAPHFLLLVSLFFSSENNDSGRATNDVYDSVFQGMEDKLPFSRDIKLRQ